MGCAMLDFNFEPGVIVPQQYGTGYEVIEIKACLAPIC